MFGSFNKERAPTNALAAQVSALTSQNTTLSSQVNSLTSQVSGLAALPSQVNSLNAQVSALQSQLATVKTNPVLALGPYVAVDPNAQNGLAGPHVIFSGANVHIVSGSGATVDSSGLGNLVIGYNEDSAADQTESDQSLIDQSRTGSHNLVLGPLHMFTASGGMVAGYENFIGSNYAAATGGACNTAGAGTLVVNQCPGPDDAADAASVSGGFFNQAFSQYSRVIGGSSNLASGFASGVTAGLNNRALGDFASVSGGECNIAGPTGLFTCHLTPGTSDGATVSGGYHNVASGAASSIGGGTNLAEPTPGTNLQ